MTPRQQYNRATALFWWLTAWMIICAVPLGLIVHRAITRNGEIDLLSIFCGVVFALLSTSMAMLLGAIVMPWGYDLRVNMFHDPLEQLVDQFGASDVAMILLGDNSREQARKVNDWLTGDQAVTYRHKPRIDALHAGYMLMRYHMPRSEILKWLMTGDSKNPTPPMKLIQNNQFDEFVAEASIFAGCAYHRG